MFAFIDKFLFPFSAPKPNPALRAAAERYTAATQSEPSAQTVQRVEEPPEKRFGRRCLKVKLKSLAEESRIIRLEEERAKGELRNLLHEHRVHDVRDETRATHIAYNYIRGKTFAQTENKSKKPFPMDRVKSMVKKYGSGSANMEKELEAWYSARSED